MTAAATLADLRFHADPSLAEPIYLQLAAALREAIRTGRVAVGARLPSERLFAESLRVSRTTVTSAYQELKAAGLLRGYVGRGAIVITADPDQTSSGTIPWPRVAARHAFAPPPLARSRPDVISFGDGWLHPSLVPRAALEASVARAMKDPFVVARAAPVRGLPALQDALVDLLHAQGVKTAASEVLVTGGAQQGLDAIARALIAPGDTVLCESPTWYGAVRTFRAAGAVLVGISMDHEGVDPDALEESLVRLRPKFIYLIPSFHCPTGRLMGVARRRRILEMCARFRTPIGESHVYGEIAFGTRVPSLKSLDSLGIVIHQGSASKTISPALRLGWLVAPRAAIDLVAAAKSSLDLSTPALTQTVLAGFLTSSAYARHQVTIRNELQARRDALIGALAMHCPALRYARPQGGLYLWAQLPDGLQAQAFEVAAAAAGVAVRGGDAFFINGGPSSHVRLCFAAPARDEIVPGAERLGSVLRTLAQRTEESSPTDQSLASV